MNMKNLVPAKVPGSDLFSSNQGKLVIFSVTLNVKKKLYIEAHSKESYSVSLIAKMGAIECHSICFSFSCPRTNLPLLDICGLSQEGGKHVQSRPEKFL